MIRFVTCLAAAILATGCAPLEPQAATETSDKVYRTGSNIPKKRGGSDVRVLAPGDLESLRSNRSANTGRAPSN